PLAEAVVNVLKEEHIGGVESSSFESITARGVKGEYNNVVYFIGNQKLMDENSIQISDGLLNKAVAFQKKASTVVYFSDSENVLAVIAIADQVKETST